MILYTKDTISDGGRIKIEKVVTSEAYPIHRHDFLELVYIMSGGGIQLVDDQSYHVSHGDLLFIDYGQTHSLIPHRSMTYVHILLEPEFFSRELLNVESIIDIFCCNMFSEFAGKQEGSVQCISFQKEERDQVDQLLHVMLQEYEQKNLGYLTVLRAQTQTLFAWMLRKMNSDIEKVLPESVQDVLEYINEHFTEKIELGDIAAKGFYNPNYLSRILKKSCGKSFTQYIKEKRLAKAAELLRTTDMPVNDVMIKSGYTDSKMFYRHFKELHDTSPGSYRQNYRKETVPKDIIS